MARTVVAAAAGGTASVLSGGKFANGAVTGAMAQLFNAEGGATAVRTAGRGVATRLALTAGTAATFAAMDGPLPIGDLIGGGLLVYDLVTDVIGSVFNVDLNEGQQGKHVPGHNNYLPGRSELLDPDPQGLLDQGAGTGQQVGSVPVGQPGSKERVDWGRPIGNYVDPQTGNRTPTSNGIIHYGKGGAHIVPSRP